MQIFRSFGLLVAVTLLGLAAAGWTATVNVVSDSSTIWTQGSGEWNYSVLVTPHPAWPTDLATGYGAQWIWSVDGVLPETSYGPLHFRQFIKVPPHQGALSGTLRVNADNGYIIYLNGQLLGFETGQALQSGDPLDWMWTGATSDKAPTDSDEKFWSKSVEYVLDDSVLVTDTNILDIYAVNWFSYYTLRGRWIKVGVGQLNPGAVAFAAQVNYTPAVPMKVTPDTLFTYSSGNTIKVTIDPSPPGWRDNWQSLLLNGVIPPVEVQYVGGSAWDGAMNLIYDRTVVQDYIRAYIGEGVWPATFLLYLQYNGYATEKAVNLGANH